MLRLALVPKSEEPEGSRGPLLPDTTRPNGRIPFYVADLNGPATPANVFTNPKSIDPECVLSLAVEHPGLYFLFAIRDVMRPAWAAGDVLAVSASKTYFVGDLIVVIPKNPNGHMAYRELAAIDADWLTLREYNPRRDWKYARAEIAEIHRIVEIRKFD